jgi:hypothetical protein
MHAVKIAHADQRRAKACRNIFEFVKDLHLAMWRGRPRPRTVPPRARERLSESDQE